MSRIHRLTAVAGTVAALVGSPAVAMSQDLRSPDARDASVAASPAPVQDQRSPDARDASVPTSSLDVTTSPTAGGDLRSPDARAAADGDTPVVVQVQGEPDTGVSWDSAAIGALVAAGLLISLAGVAVLVSRRRTRPAV